MPEKMNSLDGFRVHRILLAKPSTKMAGGGSGGGF